MLIAVGGVALLGVGCAGNTEAPTNVGAHSAQLNGHGHANSGPAFSYFEYWKTANPANKLKTPTRNWPAGAQGSISERPQHLSENTAYSYRVCGNDQGKNPICTSIKQFNTGVARSHLDFIAGQNVFQDDPGVNSNLDMSADCAPSLCPAQLLTETKCGGQTCGSQIVTDLGSCSRISDTVVSCNLGGRLAIKLGDLDDVANVAYANDKVELDGGSGDDSLTSGQSSAILTGATLTGGTGRDTLTTGFGADTINARSAIPWIDPDIDASISCGAGNDTVIADRQDPISAGQNGCEQVSKP